VDEYELLKDAVLRKLEEETGLGMTAGYLELHLRGVHTFDLPVAIAARTGHHATLLFRAGVAGTTAGERQ